MLPFLHSTPGAKLFHGPVCSVADSLEVNFSRKGAKNGAKVMKDNLRTLSPQEANVILGLEWDDQQAVDRTQIVVLLSSVFGRMSPRDLAEWPLESNLEVRMQLQLQKFIWDPVARGV